MCRKKYNLKITGAMCMPPAEKNPRKYFDSMYQICKENIENISMGMSNDYKEAIICGATTVRIGSLILEKEEVNYYENNLLPWKGY